jgi:hypothetical protein
MGQYTPGFYSQYEVESTRSAQRVVPHLMELLSPGAVIDVGCGIGTWLSVFHHLGVETIRGIDGSHVHRDQLRIPSENFLGADLRSPVPTSERYDLCVSLEVAEHLPASRAEQFVSMLVSLSDVVLFSAAIPHQGGDQHVNEQWPMYWARLFAKAGYETVDWLRPRIWNDPEVEYYYAQNSLLYMSREQVERLGLQAFVASPTDANLAKVHPRKWEEANDPCHLHLKHALRGLPFAIRNMVTFRLAQLLGRR